MRRCMVYAKDWGFGSMVVGNLFAYRTTWPEELKKTPGPVGRFNDKWLLKLARESDMTVAFWGNHGSYLDRSKALRSKLGNLHCFKITVQGQPHHTRGLPNGLMPQPYY